MKDDAAKFVAELLTRRLERAGIRTGRPEAYFLCEPGEPQSYARGKQVPVRTMRHWSDAHVKLDADTGEPLGYMIARLAEPPSTQQLSREQAEAMAGTLFKIPHGAVVKSVRHVEWAKYRWLAEIEWIHVHKGMRVDGDWIRAAFHPATRRVVEFERFWREVR